MINYQVKYRINRLFARWKRLKRVKGDGLLENGLARFFILENEVRIEIPVHNTIFKFSKERFYSVKDRMEDEIKQPIQLEKK